MQDTQIGRCMETRSDGYSHGYMNINEEVIVIGVPIHNKLSRVRAQIALYVYRHMMCENRDTYVLLSLR